MQFEQAMETRRTTIVTIEGLGDVRVQAYSSADKTKIEQAHVLADDPAKSIVKFGKFREVCCAMAIVDDDGKRLYDPEKKEDIAALSRFDGAWLEQITEAAMILSAMKKEAREALGKD